MQVIGCQSSSGWLPALRLGLSKMDWHTLTLRDVLAVVLAIALAAVLTFVLNKPAGRSLLGDDWRCAYAGDAGSICLKKPPAKPLNLN
jgi:hypothetical protein